MKLPMKFHRNLPKKFPMNNQSMSTFWGRALELPMNFPMDFPMKL